MAKKRGILLFGICMLTLVACGEKQPTGVSLSTETPIPTGAPASAEATIPTNAPMSTEVPELTPIPTELPMSTESPMPEIAVAAKNWPQVQAELEQQNLKYAGYYTLMMDRLDVAVEDGRSFVFLYCTTDRKDEIDMWDDYNEEREPEEYILVMEDEDFSTAAEITITESEAAENILIGNVESYHLQCQPVIREFTIQDNQVVEIEKDYYEYRGNSVTVLKSVPLYAERGDDETCGLLEEGETVIILGGDLKEWVQLESSGEKFWIRVEWHDCYLPDGTTDYSGSVFDGLTFYG